MGGAPYLAVIYRNAVVVRLAGRFSGVTRDPGALRVCHDLAKDAKGPEMVANAIWEAQVLRLDQMEFVMFVSWESCWGLGSCWYDMFDGFSMFEFSKLGRFWQCREPWNRSVSWWLWRWIAWTWS